MPPPKERHICAVCGRVLDYWEGPSGEGWRHSFAARDPEELDHEPVPVPVSQAPEQLRERCDFCYTDQANWIVPTRDFSYVTSVSVGNWAACDACAELIGRNDWNGLLRRVEEHWNAARGVPMDDLTRKILRKLYRELRKNIYGSVKPNEGDEE